jgi:acyl-CoA reductase-like NAD-dependent aldehyde dehydrogenase
MSEKDGYWVKRLVEVPLVPTDDPEDFDWYPLQHHFGLGAFGQPRTARSFSRLVGVATPASPPPGDPRTSSGYRALGEGLTEPSLCPRAALSASEVPPNPPDRIAAVATTTKTFKNYIGGEWVDAASGKTFESRNPANGETIGVFPRSSTEDVDRAVEAAKQAYEDWRLVPAPRRGEILFRFAQLLAEQKDDFADLMAHEMGKVLSEASGDVQEAIDMSFYMGGEGRRLFGQTTPSELRDKFNMSVRMPIGVVGVITPWNFPIAIPSWKIAPALVCGNTIVFKPATDTPLLGERFVELLAEAGIPAGVVNVVHGGGGEVGDRLVRHPDVPVITLTGSRETGVAVLRNAADNLKHVHLELGGKNAIIVLGDADLDLAVEGIVWSAFGTSGQRCTAASRVIVQTGVYDELQRRLVEAAEKLRLGPGWEEGVDVGPVINKGALEKIHSYTGIGKDEGAKLLTGGEVAGGDGLGDGHFYRPTIFGDVDPGMRIAQEEIFGPTTALIRVKGIDEAVRVSNGIEFGLSSSIFTRDVNKAFRAMRDLEAGITYINAGTIGAEVHLPFGGVKGTGNGHREAGQAALDVFTEWKSIYVDYSGKLQKAQIDTAE